MTKSIEAVKQSNGLWTVTTVETMVEKDVVCTIKDIIVPPPVVIPPTTSVLFHDDFTSMDLSKKENGIYWGSGNHGSGEPKPVVTNECMYNGKPSLKFTFGGGKSDDDAWSEQRINLPSLPEFWIEFRRYYPNGKEAVSVGPKWIHRNAPGSDNNKFMVFWGGNYGSYTTSVGISTLEDGAGHDIFYPTIGSNQGMAAGQHGLPSVSPQDDSTLGQWVNVKVHVKCATPANNDGVLQFWEDNVLKMDNRALPIYPKDGIGNAFTEGYLMGWSNTGFEQTTYCYIADFKLNDKPI